VLPRDIAKQVPKSHLMTEEEWRGIGVQQSKGWVHYMFHQPGKLFYHTFNMYVIAIVV
jgi:cyclin-dependent kinase regulatory subunit CKS1